MKPIGRILFVALAALLAADVAAQPANKWLIETVAGTGARRRQFGFSGDGGPAVRARLSYPGDVALDAAGNLYIAEESIIRKVTVSTGVITTVVTSTWGGGGVALDAAGNIYYIPDSARVGMVGVDGNFTTIAGTRTRGHSGDGGPAVEAQLDNPGSMALDNAGNLYIAVLGAIRKVDAEGVISTVAGTGVQGFSGDGGPAVEAQLYGASGVAIDGAGNLYIADGFDNRIRKVGSDGNISTIAGTGGWSDGGHSGDGGPAVEAQLNGPGGVALDGSGNLYIADTRNNRIRKVDTAGVITTVAGTGTPGTGGFSGDGGPAVEAQLYWPGGMALDNAGNLYIADPHNHRVRRLTPVDPHSQYPPRISSGGIVLATGAPVVNRISPNAIISVFGREFTPEGTQAANPALDAAGRIPTELAGVCLEIDGKRAPLFAVFPGQINAQAPHDLTPRQTPVVIGTSEVMAIRNCGAENEQRSFAAAVEVAALAPAFFNFHIDAGGRNPIVAVRSDGALAGPPGAVPGVEGLAPAEPGEILTFWGTGFGLTDPLLEAGQIPNGAAPITGEIEFAFGGITLFPEDVLYAGAAPGFAGIYQFAVRVPRGFPDSLRAPVIATVNGVSTPEGPFLTVRRRE